MEGVWLSGLTSSQKSEEPLSITDCVLSSGESSILAKRRHSLCRPQCPGPHTWTYSPVIPGSRAGPPPPESVVEVWEQPAKCRLRKEAGAGATTPASDVPILTSLCHEALRP